MSHKTRILIVDDHEIVRHGLKLALNLEPDFEVIGEAADGESAILKSQLLKPDIILLDWKMPKIDGLAAAAEIKQKQASARTIILSGALVETAVFEALEEAVDGFVHKDISPESLAHAIRTVAKGNRYVGPEIMQALLNYGRQKRVVKPKIHLSGREQEVLQLMATPATYQEIAAQLIIGEETVRTYVKRIFKKLNQPNRTQAVMAALRLGLIELNESG